MTGLELFADGSFGVSIGFEVPWPHTRNSPTSFVYHAHTKLKQPPKWSAKNAFEIIAKHYIPVGQPSP